GKVRSPIPDHGPRQEPATPRRTPEAAAARVARAARRIHAQGHEQRWSRGGGDGDRGRGDVVRSPVQGVLNIRAMTDERRSGDTCNFAGQDAFVVIETPVNQNRIGSAVISNYVTSVEVRNRLSSRQAVVLLVQERIGI